MVSAGEKLGFNIYPKNAIRIEWPEKSFLKITTMDREWVIAYSGSVGIVENKNQKGFNWASFMFETPWIQTLVETTLPEPFV